MDDPVLERMAHAGMNWYRETKEGGTDWLTYIGGSGTGKTHLMTMMLSRLQLCGRVGQIVRWPRFMCKMRTKEFNVYESVGGLIQTPVLLLDEIGVGSDETNFALDLLIQVLEGRRNRPTAITSNLSLGRLAQIDARISSRLVRNGVVVECDTTDYALRPSRGVYPPPDAALPLPGA